MGRPKREDGKNAQAVAVSKYQKKVYDRICINVYKGNREKIQIAASEKGQSVNGYINSLLALNIPDFKAIESEKEQ